MFTVVHFQESGDDGLPKIKVLEEEEEMESEDECEKQDGKIEMSSGVLSVANEKGAYLNDGVRKIDMVIAYESGDELRNREWRATFQNSLINAGLVLELETAEDAFDSRTKFIKIHAPTEVINRNAEIAGLKPAVREYGVTFYSNRNKVIY